MSQTTGKEKVGREDEKVAEAADIMEDTALTEVVAEAAEKVAGDEALANAVASEINSAL